MRPSRSAPPRATSRSRPTRPPPGPRSGRRSRSCAASCRSPSRWRSASRRCRGRPTGRSPRRSRSPRRRWAGRSASALTFFTAHLHRAARGRGQRPRQRPRTRRLLVPRRRGRAAARDLPRLPVAHRPARRHQDACSSTTAPSTRRSPPTRTTSSSPPESAQTLRHRARALRHQLPAHGDGHHHRRVLVHRSPEHALILIASRIVLIPVIAGAQLRGHPLRGEAHGQGVGPGADEARACCCRSSPPASPRSTRSRWRWRRCEAVLTAEQLAEVDARARRPAAAAGSPAPPSADLLTFRRRLTAPFI